MSIRIRLSRAKGWRMPAGGVSVARPHRWGNPFSVERFGRERSIQLFKCAMEGGWSPDWIAEMDDAEGLEVYRLMMAFQKSRGVHPVDAARSELRGRPLACWCSFADTCHADELLRITNS